MGETHLRAGAHEPGLALSTLVAVALMLGLFILSEVHFIAQGAKTEASLPVDVEVSIETVAAAGDAPLSPAASLDAGGETPAAIADKAEAGSAPPPASAELEPSEPPPAEVAPVKEAKLEGSSVLPAIKTESLAGEEGVVDADLRSGSSALPGLPGNGDLMPVPRPVNRLNPALAGMPMPSRPKPAESLPTLSEGLSVASDAPELGSAAPELQVTAVSGQGGESTKKGKGIVVQALINHLGVVEGVEILEGSKDRVADVMAVNALKQQRFKFSPPIPPGQRVLRPFTLNLSAEDLP